MLDLVRALASQGVNLVSAAVGVMVPGGLGATDTAFTLVALLFVGLPLAAHFTPTFRKVLHDIPGVPSQDQWQAGDLAPDLGIDGSIGDAEATLPQYRNDAVSADGLAGLECHQIDVRLRASVVVNAFSHERTSPKRALAPTGRT